MQMKVFEPDKATPHRKASGYSLRIKEKVLGTAMPSPQTRQHEHWHLDSLKESEKFSDKPRPSFIAERTLR